MRIHTAWAAVLLLVTGGGGGGVTAGLEAWKLTKVLLK